MPETTRSYPDPVSSISFTELLGVFFKGFLKALQGLIHFLFRNKILIICSLAIGALAGFGKYRISPVYYKVDMLVRHTEMTTQTYGKMIASLNMLVETGSCRTLTRVLGVDTSVVEQIRSISAKELDGKDLLKDTSMVEDRSFIIEMTVRRAEIAYTLQDALLKYFNDNPYVTKQKQDQSQLYLKRLELMDGEMRRIDSLTEAYTRSLSASKGAGNFYNNAFNSAELLREFESYADNRQNIEGWLLEKRQALLLIDGVKPSVAPASASLFSVLLLYAAIFLVAGCLLAGILELRKKTL